MYMDGVQMNRYANKMKHKRKIKSRNANKFFLGSRGATWDDVVKYEQQKAIQWALDGMEYTPSNYWQEMYLSGCRRLAKDASHSYMRNKWKQDINRFDFDDISYANEHKYVDYESFIW